MNIGSARPMAVVLTIAGVLGGTAALAKNEKERVAIDWKRDPKVLVRRAPAHAPEAPELPPELAVALAKAGPHVEASHVPGPPRPGFELEDLARRAGFEIALEAAREWGWREYWRAGFARGVAAALDDPRLGAWDREEGHRFGRFDPRARVLGDRLANEAAVETASREAEARVRDQFMDLTREPRPDRTGARGPSRAGIFPELRGPWAAAPIYDAVFSAYPLAQAPDLSRDGRRAIQDWRFEPRAARAYDARWNDPAFAFSIWRDRQRPRSYWSRLTSADRERFRAMFSEQFVATLGTIDLRPTYAGWRIGFTDGWRYGAAIQAEWAYRQGYAEGFDLGVQETAAIAFPYAYDRAYTRAYDSSFYDWSSTVHPGVTDVRLADDSDDGIFEPGERALVAASVVNYGGASGTFDITASGGDLGEPGTTSVRFAGRGRASDLGALSLRIRDRVPPRTRGTVTVAIGEARAEAPLYVSRPLEFTGEPTIDADRLDGRVTLTFAIANTSRRDARAIARVDSLTGRRETRDADLGLVPAGRSREASVTFDGIHPLDLIGGESRWSASVARGGRLDDAREIRIAPVAADLTNPDLLDFMIALAGTPKVSRSDVQEARSLMMERLRADWERAAEASGNPYKRDFESAGAETVLGQLVRVTQGGRRSFASPQVFDGMDGDVAALSDDLPGAHPLLRKWMKKLAKRMG